MEVLNLCSPSYDEADSYGIIGSQLVKQLSAMGVHVNPFEAGSPPDAVQTPELKTLLAKPIRGCLGSIALGYPTLANRFPVITQHGPRILVTMWESSVCPAAWIPILNRLDAVIVPSTFCKTVFTECGVTTPIHVVPLGVGDAYQYAERPTDRPLTFLTFADRGARKGGITALNAFLMAFGEDMRYRLIFKMRNPKQAFSLLNPNVEVIQRDMSEQELYELYLSADVLINPHKGEGFGLLPREASASGCISLTTAWSGTEDHLEQWGYPLPYSLEKAEWKVQHFAGQDLGSWAICDPREIADVLRHVADHREQYRAAARQKAQAAIDLYSWRTFAEKVLAIWQDVQVQREPARERIMA